MKLPGRFKVSPQISRAIKGSLGRGGRADAVGEVKRTLARPLRDDHYCVVKNNLEFSHGGNASGVATAPNYSLFIPSGTYFGGVMFWRGVALSVVAVLLSGCASERIGTDYAAMVQKVGPPRSGQSRVVVLQERKSTFGIAYCICKTSLDGQLMGELKPGTYLYADRPAGRHQILSSETLFPADSKRDITTESGRTYFFLVKASDRHNTVSGMAMAGGLAGVLVASVATSGNDNPGPVDFFLLDESAARTTIAELQLAE
jgi:hypothetical protein